MGTPCFHKKYKVIETRTTPEGVKIRRKECVNCGDRTSTYELGQMTYRMYKRGYNNWMKFVDIYETGWEKHAEEDKF